MTATSDTRQVSVSTTQNGMKVPAVLAEHRLGVALAALVGIVAIVAAIMYLSFALEWRSQTFFGALVNRNLMVDGSRSVSTMPFEALTAGMRRGDQIIGINGQMLADSPSDFNTARANFLQRMAALDPGDPIEVAFIRPTSSGSLGTMGSEVCDTPVLRGVSCTITYALGYFSENDFFAFFIVPFASGVTALLIGLTVLVMRPNQLTARLVAITLFTMSIFMTGIFDANSTWRIIPVWLVATLLLGGMMLALAFVFPTKTSFAFNQPGIYYVPVAVSLVLAGAIIYAFLNPMDAESASSLLLFATGLALLGSLIFTIVLSQRRRNATNVTVRDQINTVLIGVVLSFAVGILWLINTIVRNATGVEPLPLNTSAAMPFVVVPAFSMAYAVLQYRSFDTDKVISQALTYTVMLSGLIAGYFLLVFSASLITRDVVRANDPILIAIVMFLVAILFVPIRTRIQSRIDRLYFRTRVNYQTRVEDFAQELTSMANFNAILQSYRQQLQETLQPEQLFIFLSNPQTGDYIAARNLEGVPTTDVRFAPNSPLVEALRASDQLIYLEPGKPWPNSLVAERARLLILRTLVIAGFRGASQLNGFVFISPPLSKTGRYSFEELRFIQNLTSQISVAVERAQVVDSLERRVRELDVLSQVSQAVNFTVEFDDLLELISTQADKLINATHFYIVMRDAAMNELYYAFFLEDDERIRDNENKHWPLSSDLYSEVIRTGQSMRVYNYAQAMAERGAAIRYEDSNLRGWMGVPMLAGSRTLGVLAAGTTLLGRSYTDDQLKIFNDIGALAATSIDKARLFAETNARARQLSVLNDISRQLVASEFNVEELLKLITSSAADILEADAGSLLLTVEDGSGDLEFRVVYGGSGQELIGRRLPSNRGLVGEVASTGEIVIVNDVANDPRWGGELSKGAFRTNNVIAVPLTTQNRIIGVLELLNKKNNAAFSNEEAQLLTTFAGQAAVAIENARLFQMTDLQLSARVSELETLERIDFELNRSLDLLKVAEITVEWAMENSSATAGLLGIVFGDPPRMDVVYKFGYEKEDAPEAAEGNLWPLDEGIVSRVMRTKQVDLVPDVSIDPDYVPSLRDSKSQITIPMLSGGQINALLVLETDREPRLKLADLPFLQRLAEHASIAIANAQFYAELTRANASKSEFVSFVAHELKNPLTSIKGYSDVLLGGAVGGLSDQQKSFLGTIRFNAERMDTLVSDLNDVTKLQTNNLRIERAPISFRTIVTETLRPLQKQIQDKGQELVLNIPENLPLINADQNRLIQVLTNLISNAHKYSPANGSITVNANTDSSLRDQKGRLMPPSLVASVRDTGIGMSEEDIAKLFTPYFRSENPAAREQPGTGLGLTITKGIIEQHGGMIRVESELGKGTSFNFSIPLAVETEQVAK